MHRYIWQSGVCILEGVYILDELAHRGDIEEIVPVPRLTQKDYEHQRDELTQFWQEDQSAFALLPVQLQSDLHHFYALAEDLNPDQLLRHRKAVTAKDSSLPQRAGKALHRLVSARISNSGRASSVPEPYLRRRGGQVVAQPVLRARPDVKMLAEAVLTMMGEPGHQQSSRLRKTKADGDLAVDELQRHVDHYRQTGTISRHRYSLLIAHCHLAAVTYPEQSKVCAEQGVAVGDLLPTQEWGPLLRRAHVHLVALSSMEPGRGTEARWAEVLELLRQGAR